MTGLKEFIIALSRVVLGIAVLLGGLLVLDIIVYLGTAASTSSEKIMAAYDSGYDLGYVETYEVGYQEAHGEAYEKGYYKGYEIGLGIGYNGEVGSRVEIGNPTYEELIGFLARDETDSNPFINGEYVCFDFAAELNNNAETSGFRAAYVRIRSEEWAHAVVAFETVDKGLVFIEPQSDMEVGLVIGRPYPWWLTGASSPMRYVDAIEEIQIIW